ncbi:actin-like ATPase domain-containing protein [Daldinia caldariorum]|uniref:actin-like ATPase domain-containing protein n=1 Tax=Daldinia caldariorum TaxID=326644 RepID=UPI00200867B4|nr:actin-like ATPase domain-containing protein [Daldinia caldariorum]KAI1466627.1 actin-like ATPase domain-containing protein [Daldinia caldariorum]
MGYKWKGKGKGRGSQGPLATVSAPAGTNQLQSQPQAGVPQPQNGSRTKRVGSRELGAILEPFLDHPAPIIDEGSSLKIGQSAAVRRLSTSFPNPRNPRNPRNPQNSPSTTPRANRASHRDFVRQKELPSKTSRKLFNNMASQQGKWREDQILVVCPGSQTTMAQLGCNELTPPAHRIPTRMFKDPESDEYTPYRIYKRKKTVASGSAEGGDKAEKTEKADDQWEYVEDRDSVEGAIYPLQGGRIVNMPAFLAFLDHVHSLLTTTYHNIPIVLMASPRWTRPDCEAIARYVFEKTKTPALCLLHSAVAAQYGLKWPTMTVVDIGYEKVDVTCIHEYLIVSEKGLGYPNPEREISGGEVFTQKLLALLKDKGFNYEMAEQLKKSSLCEVLPYAPDSDNLMELPTDDLPPTAAQAPNNAPVSTDPAKPVEPPKPATAFGGETEDGIADGKENDEGVLDVANIVTSGNTREFLAKKEKEKAEKVKSKKQGKAQEAEPAAAKPVRLPNSKRKTNVFHYEELVHEDVEVSASNGAPKAETTETTETTEAASAANGDAPAADVSMVDATPSSQDPKPEIKPEAKPEGTGDANSDATESTSNNAKNTERRTKRVRRDIEIGLERFLFADRHEINRITDTIYRAIQSIDEPYKRPGCWDNLVFVGNGSRLRGLKENIIQTLTARHLISPSTATIFTSELPSNMATPSGTGSQTPTGSFTGQLPTTSSVNPLLQAATTASLGVPGTVQAPGSTAGDVGHGHHSHAQTPTSIKAAPLPTYLAEWTKNGFEEAMFLGSLIAARLAFCIHNMDAQTLEAQRTMSLNRVDYNEHGPKLIHVHSMLGNDSS